MPLNGGDEIRILDQPPGDSWWNWSLARNGIYFFGSNNLIKSGVNFFDFASSKKILLAAVDRPSVGVAVSPDGKSNSLRSKRPRRRAVRSVRMGEP